jgi:2TM domain
MARQRTSGARMPRQANTGTADDEQEAAMTDDARYEEARRRVQAKKAFFAHAAVFVLLNVVFLIVAGWSWLWVTLFWGLGLALQAFSTFFSSSDWFKGWEERQIQKELARDGSSTATAPLAPPPAAPAAPPAAAPPTSEADTTQS